MVIVCLSLPRKVQRSGAVAIPLENLLRDFYCRTTVRSPNCSIVRFEWLHHCRSAAAVPCLLNRNYANA